MARLYSHPDFRADLEKRFEGDYRLRFHLGTWPFARTDARTGAAVKTEASPWVLTAFKWMARLKGRRGSLLDPFRYGIERQLERQLVAQYEADMARLPRGLDARSHGLAAQLAALPKTIRGYGHVKQGSAQAAARERDRLFAEWEALRLSAVRAA